MAGSKNYVTKVINIWKLFSYNQKSALKCSFKFDELIKSRKTPLFNHSGESRARSEAFRAIQSFQ